jgi:hypothetical protein
MNGKPRVVHLSVVRARSRLGAYQEAIGGVLASNRRSISRLHASGAIFSPEGARAGCDLLLAHRHLLQVVALLQRLSSHVGSGGRRALNRSEAAYRRLDRLLERTSALAERSGTYLERIAGN